MSAPCGCKVGVAAISFNHDTASMSADAFNVRRNFKDAVSVPEWTPGKTQPTESPAAYAIEETLGHTITIQAKFTISTTDCTHAEIRAEGGGILGAVDAQVVAFSGGVSLPELVSIPLRNQTIALGGIRLEDITWTWQYRCPGETSWQLMETTRHRIYVVLEKPTLPWQQQPFSYDQNPWTDALDYACVWARGKTTRDDAAAAITRTINGKLGLIYDISAGTPQYIPLQFGAPSVFELTKFLDYVKTGKGLGRIVNCNDCATITTTFANLVGCDLHASVIGWGFVLTPVKVIGHDDFGCPEWGCSFRFHEVAWKDDAGNADPLFDACLTVDGDCDPWAPPHADLLPLNIIFSTNPGAPLPLAVPFSARSYKERLCSNDERGIGSCHPDGPWSDDERGRRRVR